MRAHLTPRQTAVYEFVAASIKANGYAPTLEEIAAAIGVRAVATAHMHLENLTAKGYITRERNAYRSIALVVDGACCPTCGQAMPQAT